MKLKVKEMAISTGGPLIAILNKDDAADLDLHPMDRIKISRGKKKATVVVDLARKEAVEKGSIGLMDEVIKELKLKHNDTVKLYVVRKPLSLEMIKKKLDGLKMNINEQNYQSLLACSTYISLLHGRKSKL